MPSFTFVSLATFFCLLASCSRAAPGEKMQKNDREKRDAPGLFPFPRVGRNYPLTWSFFPFFDPERQNAKREQLIPFPRVGKSGPKRNGASGGGGLWFGPRLGRVSKRMELMPVAYRQEDNIPENFMKPVLKNPTMKNLGNSNDIEDYIDAKQ